MSDPVGIQDCPRGVRTNHEDVQIPITCFQNSENMKVNRNWTVCPSLQPMSLINYQTTFMIHAWLRLADNWLENRCEWGVNVNLWMGHFFIGVRWPTTWHLVCRKLAWKWQKLERSNILHLRFSPSSSTKATTFAPSFSDWLLTV